MNQRLKRPLHLLIDGADKVGKSTVIKLLSRELNLPIIKMPNMKEYLEKGTPEEFSKLFNETIVQFAEFSFIMDRGFTSSRVYSTVFKRKVDLKYIDLIEQVLDPQIFILLGPQLEPDDIKQNNEKREEIQFVFETLADGKGWEIVETKGKSPIEICNQILENISLGEE